MIVMSTVVEELQRAIALSLQADELSTEDQTREEKGKEPVHTLEAGETENESIKLDHAITLSLQEESVSVMLPIPNQQQILYHPNRRLQKHRQEAHVRFVTVFQNFQKTKKSLVFVWFALWKVNRAVDLNPI